MAVHVRNLKSPSTFSTNYATYRWMLWLIREIAVELGGWSEDFKTTDSAWASVSNLLLTVTDAAVSSSNPRRITSATGGFTGHADDYVTLKAANDQNKGVYRIQTVVDDNAIFISLDNAPPDGWITESGITARVHNCGQGLLLATTEVELVLGAPAGSGSSLQAHLSKPNGSTVGQDLNVKALPKGDYSGAQTFVANSLVNGDYNSYVKRINAYLADQHMFFYLVDPAGLWELFEFGELLEVSSSDTYPGFSNAYYNVTNETVFSPFVGGAFAVEIDTLGNLDGQVSAHSMYIKSAADATGDGFDELSSRLYLQNRKIKAQRIYYCMDDVSEGGYVRGYHPFFRMTNKGFPNFSPYNNSWFHLDYGLLVPRNGSEDFIISAA